jgi:hypothetical protein
MCHPFSLDNREISSKLSLGKYPRIKWILETQQDRFNPSYQVVSLYQLLTGLSFSYPMLSSCQLKYKSHCYEVSIPGPIVLDSAIKKENHKPTLSSLEQVETR